MRGDKLSSSSGYVTKGWHKSFSTRHLSCCSCCKQWLIKKKELNFTLEIIIKKWKFFQKNETWQNPGNQMKVLNLEKETY